MNYAFAAALLVLVPTARAQHLLQQVENPSSFPSNLFGWKIDFAADLDQDGFGDFVVSDPVWDSGRGRVYAYSGRTGLELWHVDGLTPQEALGQRGVSAVGDLTGDGAWEILASGTNVAIRIYSGADGSQVGNFNPHPGASAEPEALGDVNGDGIGDYLATYASDPYAGQTALVNGTVYVVSGASQVPIRSHVGLFGAIYGANLIGDIDGDNVQDYAFWYGCEYNYCNGGYEVHSGATGDLIASSSGDFGSFTVSRVVGVGDFDGDGRDDYHWFQENTPQFISPPTVVNNEFISGMTGATLQSLNAYSPYRIYGSVGDLDNDGRDEILALYNEFQEPRKLVALDPNGLTESWVVEGDPARNFATYSELIFGGDYNGDGNPDVIGATIGFASAATGASLPSRVQAFSLNAPLAVEDICFGDGGTAPGCTDCPCMNNSGPDWRSGCTNSTGLGAQLRARGDVRLADDQLEFELHLAPQNSFALLASAINPLPGQGPCAPGSGIAGLLLDGLRCVGGDFRRHGTRAVDSSGNVGITNASWGASGGMSGSLLAQSGVTLGQSRYFQAIFRDSVSLGACGTSQNTTNAVRVTPIP